MVVGEHGQHGQSVQRRVLEEFNLNREPVIPQHRQMGVRHALVLMELEILQRIQLSHVT